MAHRFDPTILREYDIRGIVGTTLFAADAHALGRVFAQTVATAGGRRVAVGYDGRLTSPELEAALVEGLAEGGADVVRIDPPNRPPTLGHRRGSDEQNLHRNKRSLSVDLKTKQGMEVLRRLVEIQYERNDVDFALATPNVCNNAGACTDLATGAAVCLSVAAIMMQPAGQRTLRG